MISYNYFIRMTTYLIFCLTLFNGFNSEKFINSFDLFKEFNCERDGNKFNNANTIFELNFKSQLIIDCKYTFNYPFECFNQMTNSLNKSLDNCVNITLVTKHPQLETERLKISDTQLYKGNELVLNIRFIVSNVGNKHSGQYLVEIKVTNANYSNSEYYLGTNFTFEINELGNSDDQCLFGDQCFSNICKNSKCICSKSAPISHDENCLKNKDLLESCFVTEQCQFGGHHEIICKDINGNKSCRCLPEYILLEAPNPKCLSPKQYNQTCELSEECQSFDGNSFCSVHRRCQCISKHSIDKNNECTKAEASNNLTYVIIFSTIGGIIITVIICAIFYKYYLAKQSKSKENNFKRNSIRMKKVEKRKRNDNAIQNKLNSQKIDFTTKGSAKDEISVENENIYDDVSEIRYVTNQKNVKSSYA